MLKGFGKTFHAIRKSKHLSLSKVGGNEVSKAQISRFEAEKSELTIEKFFFLLHNMRVSLDEFESIYEDYSLSDEYQFRQKLIAAYDSKDVHKLRKMYVECERKMQQQPENIYAALTATVVKVFLNLVVGNVKFDPYEIKQVQDYLLAVENWGRYEFWVFGNVMTILKDDVRDSLGSIAMGKGEFYQVLHTNKRFAIRTFHNLAFVALERGNLEQALKYLNHLDRMNISNDYLYETLLIKYAKGLYAYRKGVIEGLNEMEKSIEILEELGCIEKAHSMQKELKKILEVVDKEKE